MTLDHVVLQDSINTISLCFGEPCDIDIFFSTIYVIMQVVVSHVSAVGLSFFWSFAPTVRSRMLYLNNYACNQMISRTDIHVSQKIRLQRLKAELSLDHVCQLSKD